MGDGDGEAWSTQLELLSGKVSRTHELLVALCGRLAPEALEELAREPSSELELPRACGGRSRAATEELGSPVSALRSPPSAASDEELRRGSTALVMSVPLQNVRAMSTSRTGIGEAPRLEPRPFLKQWQERGFRGSALSLDEVEAFFELRDFSDIAVARTGSSAFEPAVNRWVIHPHGKRRMVFDAIGLLILAYDCLCIPVLSAWAIEPTGPLYVTSLISTTFWTLDIVANLLTGIYVNGELETSYKGIFRHYARSWLALDALIVATDIVNIVSEAPSEAGILRALKISRFLRLLRILRLAKGWDRLSLIADRLAVSTVDMLMEWLKPLLVILVVNHLLACVWVAVGNQQSTDTGRHWITEPIIGQVDMTYEQTSLVYQYLTSFHWSITQMTPGSMQVFPTNSWERVVNILCLVVGMMVFSSIISSLSAKLTQSQARQQQRSQHLSALRRFLRSNGVTARVAVVVERAAQEATSARHTKPVVLHDVHAVKALPSSLKMRLCCELCVKHLRTGFFRVWGALDPQGLQTLCLEAIEFKAFLKDDLAFLAQAESQAAFIVTMGALRYGPEAQTQLVGLGSILCEPTLFSKWHHRHQALAAERTVLLCISAEQFASIVYRNRVARTFVLEFGSAYHAWAAANPEAVTDVAAVRLGQPDPDSKSKVQLSALELLLPTLSLGCRSLVANVAKQADTSHRRSPSHFPGLRQEVLDGLSVLAVDDHGDMVRVVSVQALQIRDELGRQLMELGQWQRCGLRPHVKLPGKKQRGGESQADAVARIFQDKLLPFTNAVSFEHAEVEVSMEPSKSLRVCTKYIKTTHVGTLQNLVDLPEAMFRAAKSINRQSAHKKKRQTIVTGSFLSSKVAEQPPHSLQLSDIQLLANHAGQVFLYAWLEDADVNFFRSSEGEAELLKLVDALYLSDGSVQEALEAREELLRELPSSGSQDKVFDV